ncbi:MAG: prephenate dehydrogenase [Helicobacteraceae bacterium]|jgi:prephenate dehydrogenase|nr:prephenate dehydrogenase [Helicobacteraceae bacterium]
MTLGIIGLGLMGGSLALAARPTGIFTRIVGYDKARAHTDYAKQSGMIDDTPTIDLLLRASDLIVLAMPVESIVSFAPELTSANKNAIICDLGSTKTAIEAAITPSIRERFVLAHPMAGTEYSGPKAAFASLYADRIVVLCNTESNSQAALSLIKQLFSAIGMRIMLMNAKEHDRHAAFISHLPHAISYALANSVLKQEDKQSILTLAAGGFRDMSRLAKSQSTIWIDIFKQNKTEILAALDVFNHEITAAKTLLTNKEWDTLEEWMRNANALHEIFKPAGE